MTWYICILKCSPPQHVRDLLGKYPWRKKGRDLEMVGKAFNAVLTSLKGSEKEETMCITHFRQQCNCQKICKADGKSLSQSTPLGKSCVYRNGSAYMNLFAELLDWCSLLEVWPGQECGGGSWIAITWALSVMFPEAGELSNMQTPPFSEENNQKMDL